MNIQEYQNNDATYKKGINCKYSIAWDKQYNNDQITKYFNGFDSFILYEDFLNKLKDKSKGTIKNRIFYEIIKDDCKAYFDFDTLETTQDLFNIFIEDFISYFNIFFNLTLNIDDFLIFYRKSTENTEIINSIHIIVKGQKIIKHQIKLFILFLSSKNNNKIVGTIDKKIYTRT